MHKYRGGLARLRSVNSGGYTIVEVMIFLGVSAAIFLAAVMMVSGQQGKTQFQQSMRDVNSKIQNTISDVKNGVYTDVGMTCTVNPSNFDITVSASGSEQGANENCIYLGKAIHADNDNDDTIYFYTVLGSREYRPSIASSATANASKFEHTNPQAIFTPDNLTEEYKIPYGARVISSKVNGSGASIPVMGFYQALENETIDNPVIDASGDEQLVNGSQSIFARSYRGGILNNPKDNRISLCIRGTAAGGSGGGCQSDVVSRWELCLQSETSNQRALITVTTTVSGVGTELEIKDCS